MCRFLSIPHLVRFLLAAALSLAALTGIARAADENVIIVLDASGSMWGQIDGVPKIQIAREVMDGVLADLDGKAQIGVMTYGHRRKGDCSDIETLIPVGSVNRSAYMERINALNPKGKTPISASVRMAAEEMRFTEEKATVILVSDGLETCDADPCALATELEQAGVDFTAHVVGFDLKNEDTASLQCLANATGGRYLSADNADELGEAIGTVVAAAPEPEPEPQPEPAAGPAKITLNVRLAEGSERIEDAYAYLYKVNDDGSRGEEVDRGASRSPYEVEPGKVEFHTKVGAAIGTTVVDVTPETTEVELVLNAGLLKVSASESEGGEANPDAYVYVYEEEADANGNRNKVTNGNERTVFTLPAGRYYATATIGAATVGDFIEVAAGERSDLNLVLGSGYLQVQGTESEGGEPNDGVYVHVYEAQTGTDGKRTKVANGNQRTVFSIPAGRYFVTGTLGKATVGEEVEVKAGERTNVMLVLASGIMKVSAIPTEGGKPFDDAYIRIYETEKSLDGSRTQVDAGNQRTQFSLPGGRYLVEARMGMATASMEVELPAGKRVEPVISLNAGALLVNASNQVYVRVFEAEKDLEGNRAQLDAFRPNGKPVIVPAGKYLISGKKGDELFEAEVEVTAGKLAEVAFDG